MILSSFLVDLANTVLLNSSRAHVSSPFDFNFFVLSFPQMCLQCLSAPQPFLSAPSIPEKCSWSTDVPQIAQYELLREWLEAKLKDWRRQRKSNFASVHSHANGTNGHFQDHFDSEALSEMEQRYYQHLCHSFDAWKSLPEKQKQERWREECAKAFAREQEKHQETKRKLDFAEQEIHHLRFQLDQIHQPPEFATFTASTLPISRDTAAHLTESQYWSADSLISKMIPRVQASRSIQHPLPSPSPWATAPPANLNTNHTNGNVPFAQFQHDSQRPYSNEGQAVSSDEDEDLADAPGDEEDLDQDHTRHRGLEKGMLDPNLRGDNSVRETNNEGHNGGQMLMGLREYTAEGIRSGGSMGTSN